MPPRTPSPDPRARPTRARHSAPDTDLRPRRRPTQSRSRERVERIFAATRAIIARDGVGALTTPRIAREAGISVGSFYQYFPNKESALLAIYEEYLDRIREVLRGFDAGSSGADHWREYFAALLSQAKSEELRDPLIHALFLAIRTNPELQRIEAEHTRTIVGFISTRLAQRGARGSRAQLERLATFIYALNDATWYYHARVPAQRHRAEARDWELRAAMAVIASAFQDDA